MEDRIKDHPELVDAPNKLRFIIDMLPFPASIDYECVSDKLIMDNIGEAVSRFTKIEVSGYYEPFHLLLTRIEERVGEIYGNGGYCPNYVPISEPTVYTWEDMPEGFIEKVVSKLSSNPKVSILDKIDEIDELKDSIDEHDGCQYFEYGHSIRADTGDIPCIKYSNRAYNNTYTNGVSISVEVDTYNGVTIYEDGEVKVEEVWPEQIIEWMNKANKYDELREKLNNLMEEVDD